MPTLPQLALAWANPDGSRALMESYSALEQIRISLGDIVTFWKHHVDDQISASSAATWRHSQNVLDKAIRSISALADTIGVNAPGAPTPKMNGFFKRFLGKFGLA